MTIQSRVNYIALLAIGTVVCLYFFLWFNTAKVDEQLLQVDRSYHFTKTASQLNIITEQYLAYGQERHLSSWYNLYDELSETGYHIQFIEKNVVNNTLPSILNAFNLIRKVKSNPDEYPDLDQRNLLLDRAQARIRSDIQILLSASQKNVEQRMASIQRLQTNQRFEILIIVIPVVFIIAVLLYVFHNKIVQSLDELLSGVRRISGGDFKSQIPDIYIDEHQEVAQAFNLMAQKLQSRIDSEQKSRRTAEENQKRWEQLVEQDPNLIMIHIHGVIKFINSSGARMFGYDKPDSVIGKSTLSFIDADQYQESKLRIEQVEKYKENVPPRVVRLHANDGVIRFIQVESKPIKYFGQDAMQTVGLDLTSRIDYERKLEESIEEKNTLLQEIHHRVKNNLAVVSSLLAIKKFDVNNEEVATILTESEMQIKSMAMIHEKIYNSSDFTKVGLNDYITDIFASIRDAFIDHSDVELLMECENIHLNINQAVPVALILNELIINSFKHAFEEVNRKRITISIRKDNSRVHIRFEDNGKGLPPNFDPLEKTSLGMTIINTLTKQLEASLEMFNERGTVVTFSFEIRNIKGSAGNLLL